MEKKRPVNIVDIVIIIAIVAIIIGPFIRGYLADKFYSDKSTSEIEISAVIAKQDKLLLDDISVGDKVYFSDNEKLCGEITSLSYTDSGVYITDDNGERFYATNPQFCDIFLNISAIAKVEDSGTFINGDVFVFPGSHLDLYTSAYEFTINIDDIIVNSNVYAN